MSRDDHNQRPPVPGDHESGQDDGDLPASVIFTEMMRRAAGTSVHRQPPDEPPPAPPVTPPAPEKPQRSPEEQRREAQLEAQRIRRVQRRKEAARQRTMGALSGTLLTLLVPFLAAALTATILSWWTSPEALDPDVRASISLANATESDIQALPTARVTPNWLRKIGVVSGHRGPENDPGAVCYENGEVVLTENEINFAIAVLVVQGLRERGYNVELLDEFDLRLENYQAAALVSIHANDCGSYGGENPSGYLVSQAESRAEGGEDTRLRECVAEHYGRAAQIERRYGLTRDMTDYHIFREIHPTTPGIILETGFMLADQDLLVNNADMLARGIVNGVVCYLEGEPLPSMVITPTAVPGT